MWLPRSPDPDEWHVVHLDRDLASGYTITEHTITTALLEVMSSKDKRNILGWDLAGEERFFEPF
ncbi:hypothetical protein CLV40_1257 [Actinokineospora auranticolor]|uniref:Uncharacterized protein n=2 Tax=Actinokineospora auranticolor TaxID=155976 RepID=A0A2S6GEM9_9PSEU|nr:hypothetical protein CLV40_1257 [Actinokineospora auranticolor]